MARNDARNLLVTPAQMRGLDQAAIREYGIPGIVLMENAASGIAEYIDEHAGRLFEPGVGRNILFVCGKGSNGGDGFAAARKLHLRDYSVFILTLAARDEIRGDAKVNLEICERLGLNPIFATSETIDDILPFCIARAELIVDAIFGTGYRGKPEGAYESAINAINGANKKIVSIDSPSGLDGQSGAAAGACVRADVTLTLGFLKTGLISGPDTENAGTVELIDIGLPGDVIDSAAWETRLMDALDVGPLMTARKRETHKGDYGKLLLITGSPGMTGAGCMAAESALTAGAGLVYLAVPGSLAHIYESSITEAITLCAGSNVERTISYESADAIANYAGRMDAVAIGPGMSTDQETARAIRKIITAVNKPLVIDADALTAVASDVSLLGRLNAPAVLTPHEAEMARLLGTSVVNIKRNRLALAREFAVKFKVTLVLKGHHSIIAAPDGRVYVNPTGNPGMATAGSGDVLTGMITAFIGAGMDVPEAAAAAVYLHGLAGDCAAADLGERSMRATDIIRYMHKAFKSVKE
ncbi:MAG: NAD(P)H-hydrate dehydratase [Oscillospiraceae bacterium]|nr:NAD(P)H-hydrate dehydratase [Oscillospiraceae bacterium]